MTTKTNMISIQTDPVDTFRSTRENVIACFSQSSASISVAQIFRSPDFTSPKSSFIVPGAVHCAASSSRWDIVGIITDDKCGISHARAMDFEFFNVSSSAESCKTGSQIQFDPVDNNHVGILLGRDVRIYDIVKSFQSPVGVVPKPLAVISGAAAQATPVSFAYDPNSPDLIVSGWDIPNNQYLRIVDLREGTHRSVRILKTPAIHSISLSRVDNRYLSSSSDSSISIFDMRKLALPKSSLRVDPLFTLPSQGRAESISWGPLKRATLAFSDSSGLKIWRPEINRLIPLGEFQTYVWSRFDPSSIISIDSSSPDKKISILRIPDFPIPVLDPRSGAIGQISSTTGRTSIHLRSELHKSIEAIAERLGESPDNSLIDAIIQSDEETNLCKHLDWTFPDCVNAEFVAKPIIERISLDEVRGEVNRFGLNPLHREPSRLLAIELLIPRNFFQKILWLMNGEFENLLRSLIHEKFNDQTFIQSLTMHVFGGSTAPLELGATSPELYRSAVYIVNQLILSNRDDIEKTLIHAVNEHRGMDESALFLQCAFAIMYLPFAQLENFFGNISSRFPVFKSVRGIVITGLNQTNLSDHNPLHVALIGLLMTSVNHSHASLKFEKFFKFFRSLCNQLGGDSWSLRSIIDSVLVDPTHSGSTTIVCYYCNKPLMGDDLSWNANATGVICRCPNRGCHKPLPSCCVCLEPINVAPTATVFCTTCRHGGHKDHLVDWFQSADECAVAGCNCQCANVDGC